ncbi:galactarate dehydratase [Vibrio porteresiae]|uniref:Galactarate dehydratase n=1 Tax=Vibrio porteresiae DSM 19223 TaxID=1123496 RepID=A0ABZ0QFZ4_9VIBR|nr:galactarate dehydratase [Vibrio porteresiae]WPC75429.1 galactarate dehydratase [Vibrio porteresiae DSM 19223]
MKTTIPRYIKVHPDDNVAIIVNDGGLPAGTLLYEGLVLAEEIPEGHKVALKPIANGEAIVRYGEVIGYANKEIPQGGWISQFVVDMPQAPALDDIPIATRIPEPLPAMTDYTFMGYRNPDGSAGTKNLLGITTSVHCVAGVVDYMVDMIKRELLPRYPNVDGVVGLNHLYGCGVAINAPASVVPIRTIHNLALNPNFGGEVMVIGLGCEKLQPEKLLQGTGREQPISLEDASIISLQSEEHVGFQSMVTDILQTAEKHLQKLNQRRREPCPVADLVVGMQCGGSDAFSGVTANPSVGYATDLLVRCGATVMFSEVTEVRDAVHLLGPRCIDQQVGDRLKEEMRWYDDYLSLGQTDRRENPSPGNKKGGLANVVEKALGSIAKSGSSAIVEVLSPGERPTRKGLIFAATPASDFVCGTQQLSSGITMQVFTTGRGTPYGLEVVPVIKVATRNSLARRWFDLMDINAGTVATGEHTIEEKGWEIFNTILDVASGRKSTFSDQWGLHNALAVFNPAPVT